MIRFIDLRGQVFNDDDLPEAEREPLFAFFDTITDTFLAFSGSQVWESEEDFRAHFTDQGPTRPLERFTALMPEWATRPAGGDGA